jgi:hypothetical protein
MIEVQDAIRVFLEGKEHQSLLVSGDWGTGKTHLTRVSLEAWQLADPKANKWLHISLYGKKSTTEIDAALAVAFAVSKTEKIPFSKNLRHVGPFLNSSESSGVLSHFAKQFGKSHVLWLDDLERKDASLLLSDVIAYVDVFINTYGGKAICVINTDRLPAEEKDWLLKNAEKTFPRRIKLQPTLDFVESIVANPPLASDTAALAFIKALEVTNIRIAREILANAREFLKVVAPPDQQDRNVRSALTTVCVATASVAGLKDFPTPTFLREPMSAVLPSEEELSPEEKEWRRRLLLVDYSRTDRVDHEIIEQIERGYFSPAPLKQKIAKYEEESETPLNKAWEVYHNSLDGDTDAFVKQFLEGARASLLTTSINNMNSTVRLLRLLDRADLADQLAIEYAQARMALPPAALDHSEDHFFDTEDKDKNFLALLDNALDQKVATLDVKETLAAGAKAHHFDSYQVRRISKANPTEFADAFLAMDADLRNRAIKVCLEQQRRYAQDEKRAAISENTKLALKQIAGDSKLNRVRISRKFGIAI